MTTCGVVDVVLWVVAVVRDGVIVVGGAEVEVEVLEAVPVTVVVVAVAPPRLLLASPRRRTRWRRAATMMRDPPAGRYRGACFSGSGCGGGYGS